MLSMWCGKGGFACLFQREREWERRYCSWATGSKTSTNCRHVPPTTRKPQVVPPRGPPGAGLGALQLLKRPPSPPSEELVKALQLLQSVLTPEDFTMYEKKLVPPKQQERVKLREESFLRLLRGRPILRNKNRSILK